MVAPGCAACTLKVLAAETGRRQRRIAETPPPFFVRIGVNRKGVDIVSEFLGQQRVDPPVPVQQPLPGEIRRDHHHFEMRLGPGRHIVVAAFVDDFEMVGPQPVGKFSFDAFRNRHGDGIR